MNNARDLILTMSVGSYPPFPIASPSNLMYDLPALDFEPPVLQSKPPEETSLSSEETMIYAMYDLLDLDFEPPEEMSPSSEETIIHVPPKLIPTYKVNILMPQ